eukprot:207605-Pelagomonas_calceolata.AAC.1
MCNTRLCSPQFMPGPKGALQVWITNQRRGTKGKSTHHDADAEHVLWREHEARPASQQISDGVTPGESTAQHQWHSMTLNEVLPTLRDRRSMTLNEVLPT